MHCLLATLPFLPAPAGQGEGYVEFTPDGRVKVPKGAAKPVLPSKSRYEEDVWPGNHTVSSQSHAWLGVPGVGGWVGASCHASLAALGVAPSKASYLLPPPTPLSPIMQSVWGSFYDRGTKAWGYGCCHSTLFSSYCTGAAGRAARQDAERFAASAAAAGSAATSAALAPGGVGGAGAVPRSSLYGEQLAPSLDPAKMRAALERHAQREAASAAAAGGGDEGRSKKRGYNSLSGDADAGAVTQEDMEVWRMKRSRAGDPMAGFGGGGGGGGYGEDEDGGEG